MLNVSRNGGTEEPRSTIACQACRKRKIKCGRELPQCKICEESEQICEYPQRVGKPGPRIGTRQKRRKNHHESHNDEAIQSHDMQWRQWADEELYGGIDQAAPSPAQSVATQPSHQRSKDIQGLSFIMHPSHESCSPEDKQTCTPQMNAPRNEEPFFTSTCYSLGIDLDLLDRLLDEYFRSFTSFRLFREPYFRLKLQNISTGIHVKALLCAMLSFAVKMCDNTNNPDLYKHISTSYSHLSEKYFTDLAMKYVDEALSECGDEAPALCLLQALILTTNCLLIHGVRGRAWRYLGTSIRIAYELNLHLIDSGNTTENTVTSSANWCEDEERRRAWWAIWEMDVFASVIRRCPTAIDWSQNETYLPVDDEYWFRGEPRPSCYLEPDLLGRWKALQDSGNQSPKAWFIVVNSWMKEAQIISSPSSVKKLPATEFRRGNNGSLNGSRQVARDRSRESLSKLSTLYNCVRCFMTALPSHLRYNMQYLSFGSRGPEQSGRANSDRQLHSYIYGIHMTLQLTKLYIHHYHVFGSAARSARSKAEAMNCQCSTDGLHQAQVHLDSHRMQVNENRARSEYFEAADEILLMVQRSYEQHYRFVNPFLANTVWLGAAVQLVHKEFAPTANDNAVVHSNFEILCLTYKQFVNYWDISTALQQNLDMLGAQLERFRTTSQNHTNEDRSSAEQGGLTDTGRPSNKLFSNNSHNDRAKTRGVGNDIKSTNNGAAKSFSLDLTSSTVNAPPRSFTQTASAPVTEPRSNNPNRQFIQSDQQLPLQEQLPVQAQRSQDQRQAAPSMGLMSPSMSSFCSNYLPQGPPMLQSAPHGTPPTLSPMPTFFSDFEPQATMAPDLESSVFERHLRSGANMAFSSYLDELLSGSHFEQ